MENLDVSEIGQGFIFFQVRESQEFFPDLVNIILLRAEMTRPHQTRCQTSRLCLGAGRPRPLPFTGRERGRGDPPLPSQGHREVLHLYCLSKKLELLGGLSLAKYKVCYYPPTMLWQSFATFFWKRKLHLPKAFHYHLNCLSDINLEA